MQKRGLYQKVKEFYNAEIVKEGSTVNGKSSTISYKVHKVVEKSKEEYQIISDTQEAIVSENVWLRVQELRNNKRRTTATGRKSILTTM